MADKRKRKNKAEVVGFVGIGLDNSQGHRRVTTGENFFLVGGSAETHDRMIDAAVHVNDELRRQGKRLNDASAEELSDLFHDANDRHG